MDRLTVRPQMPQLGHGGMRCLSGLCDTPPSPAPQAQPLSFSEASTLLCIPRIFSSSQHFEVEWEKD